MSPDTYPSKHRCKEAIKILALLKRRVPKSLPSHPKSWLRRRQFFWGASVFVSCPHFSRIWGTKCPISPLHPLSPPCPSGRLLPSPFPPSLQIEWLRVQRIRNHGEFLPVAASGRECLGLWVVWAAGGRSPLGFRRQRTEERDLLLPVAPPPKGDAVLYAEGRLGQKI